MADATRTGGWWPERFVASAAGVFLLWRGLFGRGRARIAVLLAGALIARRALAMGRGGRRDARSRRRRSPEVIEVKSPAELEPGIATASPRPTFPNRADRGRHPQR